MSIILRGGYIEEVADAREASGLSANGRQAPVRLWLRGTVHRIRMAEAHRIIACEPGTRSLVIRGRKIRRWGFYTPTGWVDQARYDYDARRPCSEVRS